MSEFIYRLLESIGYDHPLHPPIAHVPIGLVVGLCVFAFMAAATHRTWLPRLAYYPLAVLAFISLFPVVFFGYGDWQQFYEGNMLFPIKVKLVLTGVLVILLFLSLLFTRRGSGPTKAALTFYALSFLTLTGLGYYGAELTYRAQVTGKTVPRAFTAGQKVYTNNCGGCHPNVAALSNSPQSADFDAFLAFLRKPSGGMPAFPPAQLSLRPAMHLYHYIIRYPCIAQKK